MTISQSVNKYQWLRTHFRTLGVRLEGWVTLKESLHSENLYSSEKCLTSFDHLVLHLRWLWSRLLRVNNVSPPAISLHCNTSVGKNDQGDVPYVVLCSMLVLPYSSSLLQGSGNPKTTFLTLFYHLDPAIFCQEKGLAQGWKAGWEPESDSR